MSDYKGSYGHLDEKGNAVYSEAFADLIKRLKEKPGLTESEKELFNFFSCQMVEALQARHLK